MVELRKKLQKQWSSVQVSPEFKLNANDSATSSVPSEASRNLADDSAFMELFAGEAGLTLAVKRQDIKTFEPGEVRAEGRVATSIDLSCNATFRWIKKLIKSKKVRWVHFAPPCKTFSRARRRDRIAKARVLRSRNKPEGFDPKPALVKEANLLASRSAQLALLQWKSGGIFSIENPESSFLWCYKPVKDLRNLESVQMICGDQCRFAGEYVKPTGWLTNGSFMEILAKRCTGPDGGHFHEPLMGFTTDFHSNQVFKTALAAEYPQGYATHSPRPISST